METAHIPFRRPTRRSHWARHRDERTGGRYYSGAAKMNYVERESRVEEVTRVISAFIPQIHVIALLTS